MKKSQSKKRKDKKRELRRKQNEIAIKNKDLGTIPVREICPAENLTVKEFINITKKSDPSITKIVKRIRLEKSKNTRKMPSKSLIGNYDKLPIDKQKLLLDKIASLVDENLFGRQEMCSQFALLVEKALNKLDINAKSIYGKAKYKQNNGEWFSWNHSWVIIDNEYIVDANTDSMEENVFVPDGLIPSPYWGTIENLPVNRNYKPSTEPVPTDSDVETWWIDLENFIDERIK